MLIVPIRNSDLSMRRLPLVTFAIMLTCIVVMVVTYASLSKEAGANSRSKQDIQNHYLENPYLELPASYLSKCSFFFRQQYATYHEWIAEFDEDPAKAKAWLDNPDAAVANDLTETYAMIQNTLYSVMPGPEMMQKKELWRIYADASYAVRHQKGVALERKLNAFSEEKISPVLLRWGYVPSASKTLTIISHLFVHASIWHLLINLFILWFVGPQLEDQWRKGVFILLYLGFGVVGALFLGRFNPESSVPFVGASGAIAGVMGAFAFRFGSSRIRLFYWFFLRFGTFEAPAGLLIVLWLAGQFLYGFLFDYSGQGIVYPEIIGGFAAGLLIAIVFRLTDFEVHVLEYSPESVRPNEKALVAFKDARTDLSKAHQAQIEGALGKVHDKILCSFGPPAIAPDPRVSMLSLPPEEESLPDVVTPETGDNLIAERKKHWGRDERAESVVPRIRLSDWADPIAVPIEVDGVEVPDAVPEIPDDDELPEDESIPSPVPELPSPQESPSSKGTDTTNRQDAAPLAVLKMRQSDPNTPAARNEKAVTPGNTVKNDGEAKRRMRRYNAIVFEVNRLEGTLLQGWYKDREILIPLSHIKYIAPAKIDRLGRDGRDFFAENLPPEPVYLLGIALQPNRPNAKALFIIDATQCQWQQILPTPDASVASNLIGLLQYLLQKNQTMTYVCGTGAVDEDNVPLYTDFHEYLMCLKA